MGIVEATSDLQREGDSPRDESLSTVDFDYHALNAGVAERSREEFRDEVLKFGGSRLQSREQYLELAEFMDQESPLAIVVSAHYGVTNQIESLLERAAEGSYDSQELADLWRKHIDLCSVQNPDVSEGVAKCMQDTFGRMHQELTAVAQEGGSSDLQRAFLMSRGEFLSALVLKTHRPEYHFSPSEDYISVAGSRVNGIIDLDDSKPLPNGSIATGFYGMQGGEPATTGRGGTDSSSVAIARLMGAGVNTLVKDVSGIQVADPRIVEDPPVAQEIKRDSMLAAIEGGGFGVVHPDTLHLAGDVAVRVTNDPYNPNAGTRIVNGGNDQDLPLITGRDNVTMIRLQANTSDADAAAVAEQELLQKLKDADHFVFSVGSGGYLIASKGVELLEQSVAATDQFSLHVDGERALVGLVSGNPSTIQTFLEATRGNHTEADSSMQEGPAVGDASLVYKIVGETSRPGNRQDFTRGILEIFDLTRERIPAFA